MNSFDDYKARWDPVLKKAKHELSLLAPFNVSYGSYKNSVTSVKKVARASKNMSE